ncbi:hypothetical protein [Vibrio jasicida]|uniref:Uncharacterized protein n=1 Tax=Vibrio jasicida TaxID=766224 RepID=A0AAU9QPR2_9VIBR|nr:conserved hypothetical protein [Vibrio jasicida]CAH1597782.1 conserved hypothetical protein [Vibrio jasicida]
MTTLCVWATYRQKIAKAHSLHDLIKRKYGYTPGFKLTYKVEDGRLITQRYNQQPKRPSVALGLVLVEHK